MKKQTLSIIAIMFIAMLSACGGQAAQTPLEPASPTETVLQPTQVPTLPETIAPASTDIVPAITEIPVVKTNVSFINDVMPIFERRCVKCHGGQQTKEGFDLKTYEGLMAGSFNGPVLEPGNANDSYLVEQIINGEMPNRGPKLTPSETQIITDWINSGAINN